VATRRDFVGRDSSDHRNNVNVYLTDDDWPANESERQQWIVHQISELRYALLGDDKFGVSGMVDAVRNQRIWLIVLTALVVLVIFILIWQGVQIHQILQRLG
jgi:hypothetical protein